MTAASIFPERPRRVRMLNFLPAWMDRTHASMIAVGVALPLLFVGVHEGIHYFRAAQPLPPAEQAQMALKRAQVAAIEGKPALAATEANIALSLDSTLAPAWCQRGVAMSKQGNAMAAMNDFNRTLELDPRNKTALIERGLLRHRAGDDEGANGDMDVAMALGDNVQAFQNRGIIRLETGNLLGAAEDATEALKIDRYLPGAYAIRGEAYLEAGRHVEASRDFNEWAEQAPTSALAQAWQAEVWRRDGDPRGAIRDCDKALDLDPACALAWCFRGWARLNLGQIEYAISDFEAALRFDKRCPRAHAGLGNALAIQDNLPAALAHLNQAIALHSGLLDARLLRGWVEAKLGNREEALADIESVEAAAPACWRGREVADKIVSSMK